jgi:hypothetical protein
VGGQTSRAAWAGIGGGAAVLVVATALLKRTLDLATEIQRYVEHIGEGAEGIVRNTDRASDLVRVQSLTSGIRAALSGSGPQGEGTP